MKIVLASSNKGKLKELKEHLREYEVLSFDKISEPFEIEENGNSFKENALIKARAVYEKINDKDLIVLSDDSGLSVDAFGGEPGIYSARYAGVNASSKDNLKKLIKTLKKKNIQKTSAHYTAAIGIVCEKGEFCVHGWMYGDVINEERGNNGFGYDPIFIPLGYNKTLGELAPDIKSKLSHRSKALSLAKILLGVLIK